MDTLPIVTDSPLRANSGRPAAELRTTVDTLFLSLQCQGMSRTAVVLIVTMGSYVALVRFLLNSVQTRTYVLVVCVIRERINASQ